MILPFQNIKYTIICKFYSNPSGPALSGNTPHHASNSCFPNKIENIWTKIICFFSVDTEENIHSQ